ncbi:S1 family peptidase [Duganella sp. S19_KUP01_CR8]|uniref:S1 family peptidase n=1 Tax=Duganella sp. S19_KUP01_CR8 TaxID=3025502 RepID=UPI002FCDA3A0
MSQTKFVRLAPFTVEQRTTIAVAATNFFSVQDPNEIYSILGKSRQGNTIQPLSGFEFLTYLDAKGILPEARRYQYIIGRLLDALEAAGWLTFMGVSHSTMLPKTYYSMKQATNIEGRGLYMLAQPLGVDFLHRLIEPNLIHITGTLKGDVHAGTGILIDKNIILTCAHVINDMKLDEALTIRGVSHRVKREVTHQDIDVGLIYLDGQADNNTGALPFVEPELGMNVAIFGYPKIPIARTAPLTLQKGEVTCAEIYTVFSQRLFLFSAIARPGNSGGPILSTSGQFLGLVSQDVTLDDKPSKQNESGSVKQKRKNEKTKDESRCEDDTKWSAFSPHYCGIPTGEVVRAVRGLDPAIVLPVEDYQ